jgi:hypothetical protein
MTPGSALDTAVAGHGATRDAAPRLSVIVTVVDGGDVLRRCLAALARQEAPPPMEILVPYDTTIAHAADLGREFPDVRFVDLGVIATDRPRGSPAAEHELFDRRRAGGLAAARGDLVAILEDRGVPRPEWARTIERLHQQPYAAIGGAIEPASDDVLSEASYVCDFGRYGLPFESGRSPWLSDVNVSYKRAVVDAVRPLWRERYHEPIVHDALLRRGHALYLSSEMIVDHAPRPLSLRTLLRQRFAWGRLFGRIRAGQVGLLTRVALVAAGPIVPLLLFARHARTQRRKRRGSRFLRAAPATALLLVVWSAGELWGEVTARG